MLNVNVQDLGDVTIFRCQGRIAAGDENTILRNAMLSHTDTSTLVLDLGRVAGIDAGGLGVLLGVRAWTCSNRIQLKLTNVLTSIQQVFEVTNLDRVFEICSEEDMVDLLHRAAGRASSSRPYLDEAGTVDRVEEFNGARQCAKR